MKKDYDKIKVLHSQLIKEQTEKEKRALKKFVEKSLFKTNYIIIYEDKMEMYSINDQDEISEIIEDSNVNRVSVNTILELGYKEV